MSGGGSGGSGEQKFLWNDSLAPHWMNALDEGQQLTDPVDGRGQYNPYQGPRIADLTDDQNEAMRGIRHFVAKPDLFLYGMGNEQAQRTVNDEYLTGNKVDPYAGAANAYAGENPYFQGQVQEGIDDIIGGYQRGTASDTTRMMNMAGIFGGGAHTKAVANNEAALGKSLGDFTNKMYSGQYDRSAGLEESRLSRGSNAFQGERGRQMQAVGASQNDQGLTLQRQNALMGVGDINRSLSQDKINLDYANFQDQQNHPFKMLDYYTGLLSRAQGGMAPNSQTTQPGYQASPFSQILGAGLMGYGMLGG
jgi:hypothetical protein